MPTKPEIFTNRKALSLAKGVPVEHIKAAKALSCDGIRPNGRIYWAEFSKWYEANKQAVIEYLDDNGPATKGMTEWKQRKERALALIAEIELREREHRVLDREKTIASVKSMLGSMAIIGRNIAQDYSAKVLGKNITEIQVILDRAYDEFCSKGLESLEKWKG